MANERKEDVSRRNITLHPDTYQRFDKFLLELMQKRKNPKISRNDAIEALLDEHYKRGQS